MRHQAAALKLRSGPRSAIKLFVCSLLRLEPRLRENSGLKSPFVSLLLPFTAIIGWMVRGDPPMFYCAAEQNGMSCRAGMTKVLTVPL